MALLERVATLVRANLNDLVDKAEDPEKMIKQVILDMQNQLLQVKTQVAISIADQHVLEKKLQEAEENERQWMRRAGLAVDKKDDALARAAVERSMSYKTTAASFRQQVEDQKTQVENLKSALLRLQQKMAEAESKSDMLIAQHRRARALGKANGGQQRHGRQLKCGRLRPHEEQGAPSRSHRTGTRGPGRRRRREREVRCDGEAGRDRSPVEGTQVQAQRVIAE